MKRDEFVRTLKAGGCVLARRGKKHDIYLNPQTRRKAPVPRHRELANTLCEIIRKQLGLGA